MIMIDGGDYITLGVANGKIRDSPRRRDPCLKIRARDLNALTKSEPETLYQENRARDFILRIPKLLAARHDMSYTIFNKCKIDKSRVRKCYAMTTNIRLKNPTCRTYIFKRLLSYVFNQINNSIMVLIETVGQKTKIPDSETSRPKIRESETRQRNTRKRDFETHSKRFRDFEIGTKISETLNFPDTIRHP